MWDSFLKSVDCEPRSAKLIKGASGYEHPVLSVGVDSQSKRIVLISGESDARSAALAQGDIQTALPDSKVLMVRPAAINLGKAAEMVSELVGGFNIGNEQLEWLSKESTEEIVKEKAELLANLSGLFVGRTALDSLNLVAVWKDVIQQLSFIELDNDDASFDISLKRLVALEPVEMDRKLGVCSIPLYDFSEDDLEKLSSGMGVDECKILLKKHNIHQYFYPAPDQLALGLAERGLVTPEQLIQDLERTPDEGHSFSKPEFLDTSSSVKNIVHELKEEGLLVEGDLGLEITKEGQSIRAEVRFSPREGLVKKLSRIFSLTANLDLKDLTK